MSNNSTSRVWNLWTGFIALFVTKIESQNPEIVYQNSIVSMTAKYQKLKAAAGQVIARRDTITENRDTAQAKLTVVLSQLSAAMATQDDELAVILIQKKTQLESEIGALNIDLTAATKEADGIKGSLIQVQGQVNSLKDEKVTMLARLHSAEARSAISASLDGLSTDADVAALEGVRSHIRGKVGQANLTDELRNSDLDVRLGKLNVTAGAVNARAELDRMKAAQAASATAATRTL